MAETDEPARVFQYGVPASQTPASSLEVRENFRALAQTFYTTDGAYPADPRPGQLRLFADPAAAGNVKFQVFLGGGWQTALQNVQTGTAAPDKIIFANFQTPPGSNPWVIDHNLGSAPVVQVYRNPAPNNVLALVPVETRSYIRFLGRLPTAALLAGVVRAGLLLPHNGDLLRTYAVCETPISGPVDFSRQFTLNGVPLTPLGDIIVNAALGRGDIINGVAIPAGSGAHPAGATLDIDAVVTTPPPDGALELYAEIDRTLTPNEYRVQHVTENRVEITFAQNTAGFAILVG